MLFEIYYDEERPGWDEFGGPRFGYATYEAESKEEAVEKFKNDPFYSKYCDVIDVKEVQRERYLYSE